MSNLFLNIKSKNEILFYFGIVCLVFSFISLLLAKYTNVQVNNVSAWIKPFKFSFSTFLYVWAMGVYCSYLPNLNVSLFNWSVIVLLGFEIFYIALQASKGELSHYNLSSKTYSFLYSMMALAATLVTVYTAYIGYLFFITPLPSLPNYYIWSIRLGIILFVIFAFEGFVMGSRLSHTIGGAYGSTGLPLVHWSTKFGDARVSHFIGMHALQVLPILAYFIFKNTKVTILVAIVYTFLAIFTLIQALNGKPIIKKETIEKLKQ